MEEIEKNGRVGVWEVYFYS